jgi:hypothetical protein
VAVLQAWLAQDQERFVARARIDDSRAQGNHYTIDRLVAAANAFDHLPESAVPKPVALIPEVSAAKQACEEIVQALPPCDERQSLLCALGRLGTASLKQKVRYRASYIIAAASGRFPDLDFVCNQAVNCRNHFVHGSDFKYELKAPSSNQSFLTETLVRSWFRQCSSWPVSQWNLPWNSGELAAACRSAYVTCAWQRIHFGVWILGNCGLRHDLVSGRRWLTLW